MKLREVLKAVAPYALPDQNDLTWPYLTYEAAIAPFNGDVPASASVWTRSLSSWAEADTIANTIFERLRDGGVTVPYDGGMIWVVNSN